MFRQLNQRAFLFFTAIILSLTFSQNRAQSQTVPFYSDFMNVDAVPTKGDMLVTETPKYTFSGDYKNQPYKYIPLNKVADITEVSSSENFDRLITDMQNRQEQNYQNYQADFNWFLFKAGFFYIFVMVLIVLCFGKKKPNKGGKYGGFDGGSSSYGGDFSSFDGGSSSYGGDSGCDGGDSGCDGGDSGSCGD